VLGLAFKGGTDDIRESPAIFLVQALLQEGSQVIAHDPAAMARAKEVLPPAVEYAANPYDAARGADALLILTEWEEYAQLDLARMARELKYPIVIDGRNLYEGSVMMQHGFTYYSVGRATFAPEEHAGSVVSKETVRKELEPTPSERKG
jgi:UDPglucose 6-dehydrogenase